MCLLPDVWTRQPRWLALLGSQVFCVLAAFAQSLQPFFTPPQASGSLAVKLHPMENVTPGTPRLVTFGVPFTRGSITPAGLNTVRVLVDGAEVPAHVEMLTPWRHLTSAAVDGQSVRVARVQLHHAFSSGYPNFETITVEWGGAARTLDVPTLTDPLQGWHLVTAGTFVASDGILEPDVYALLPKEVLGEGVLTLRRNEPFGNTIPESRDDPEAMDAIEHWPGFEEVDRAFKNNFYTTINEDDPLVTEYDGGKLTDYKHDSEPWLYDRASTQFLLYLKSGFLRPLREAVRSTQFYRSKLHGPNVLPATSAGLFSLKQPNASSPNGGNDAMYSYAECFAYDLWLTGNPQSVEPIRWVAATVNELADNSHWTPNLGAWTERHTALATLANIVAFEVTGDPLYRQTVLTHTADYIWHQNGAGGQLPANRLDGGLYHFGFQHGDGEPNVLVASHWMTTLTVDAMTRAYGLSEDPAIADFIVRAARFQATALIFDNEHDFDTYAGALRYPGYMIRFDGAPDLLDGHDTTAINHALDVASSVAWGAYFQHLLHGVPDPGIEAAARDLYLAFDAGVNHWIRPAAPPLGFTAFRVNPPRKFNWEHRPAAGFAWVMNQINVISPPPAVAITSPLPNALFTAPANILIEATATSANATVTKVEFFDGSTKLGEDTTAPYTFQWNGVIADTHGHVISAKATTSLGVVGQSEGVPLDVRSPTRPELTITSPANNAVLTAPATIALTTSVVPQGGSAISRVVFMRDFVPLFEDTEAPYAFTLPNVLHGTYEFEVMAFDVLGGYDLETVSVSVQTPTPPTVALTSPVTGTQAARGGLLHLSATASAPGSSVVRVGFRADGVPIGEDLTPPYELNYRLSAGWSVGAHTISARAYEANGGIADSTATIEVIALEPMTVTFDSPAANAEFNFPTPIPMQASASAPGSSITRIDFFANGQFAGSDTEAPYTASFTPDSVRQWELRARAFDAFGRSVEVGRLVQVVGPAQPTVTLTAPATGEVIVAPAAVTLTAAASVAAAAITGVQFYEGSTLLGEDTTAPFSFTTPTLGLGDHTFYAVATASTGTTAYSPSVIVTVGAANSPVVVITAPRYSGPQFAPDFSTIRLAASAQHTGGLGIARVEFWLDNALLDQDTTAPYEMDWLVGNHTGYHELVARAVDENGVSANSSQVAFELIIPPTITITGPAAGSILAPGVVTTITANPVRGTYSLAEVRFWANNVLLGTDTTAPYSIEWTPTVAGSYELDARITDTRFVDVFAESITVTVAANVAPVAGADNLNRPSNTAVAKLLTSALLANDSDPDGDALSLLAVGNAQPVGASVTLMGNWVVYTAPAANAGNGSFEYTLSDGPGGHTVTGSVTVTQTAPVNEGGPNSASIVLDGADFIITFIGVPSGRYRVQYATELHPAPTWREFAPPAIYEAAPNGAFSHFDVAPAEAFRLYRAVSE